MQNSRRLIIIFSLLINWNSTASVISVSARGSHAVPAEFSSFSRMGFGDFKRSSLTYLSSPSVPVNANIAFALSCGGVDDTAALNAAVATASNGFVVIANGQTCAARNIDLPNIRVEKGGLLKPLNSQTITLSGVFEAGAYQAFTNTGAGKGTISFAGNKTLREIYPEWWGAKADARTDSSPAVQAAINAAQTVTLVTSGDAGVPIQFGVGEYRFNSGVSYLAANNSSIVISGKGYSTVFLAGSDITILTLNQGKSSNQGMKISGIFFNLNEKDAAAIDLKFGGQLAHLEDLWVMNPSASGTKKLIQLGGEVIMVDRVMVAGSAPAGAVRNTNVGIYLTHSQTFRIWFRNLEIYMLATGLASDNQFPNGVTYSIRDSSFHGNKTAIDIGGVGDGPNGLALWNWIIEGIQFESNLLSINLRGYSGRFPLMNVTIADNYFTGIDNKMTAIRAENVSGLSIVRNLFKNATATDHTGVALSLGPEITGARLSGNNSVYNISPNMTIMGNATAGVSGGPVFPSPMLTVDQSSLDVLAIPAKTPGP